MIDTSIFYMIIVFIIIVTIIIVIVIIGIFIANFHSCLTLLLIYIHALGMMFLVVEQSIKYLRPIGPLQKYFVRTSVTVSDNKWLHYEHTFVDCSSQSTVSSSSPSSSSSSLSSSKRDVKMFIEPKAYAVINCKAVLKERNGKTVPVSTFLEQSQLYRDLLTNN